MLIRSAMRGSSAKYQPVSIPAIGSYFNEQISAARKLPESNPYREKLFVYRGIADSAAFLRLMDMGVTGKAAVEDIITAKRGGQFNQIAAIKFNNNFEGWKKHFGYQ
jgi:hypothetical protein